MFCPRCGQEQPNQDVQFCSRCGLRVSQVKELLATNGGLPELPVAEKRPQQKKKRDWFFRRPKYRFSAKILFAALALLPLALLIGLATDQPEFLLFPFFVFVFGVLCLLYKGLFGQDSTDDLATIPAAFNTNPVQGYLNPPSLFANPLDEIRIKTAEIVPQPSVTEHTTKKLKQ